MKPTSQAKRAKSVRSLPLLALACASFVPLVQSANAPARAAIEPAKPFTVFGTVTGPTGRPLAGVEIRANCGNGTLFCTGKTLTDSNGAYRLGFGPGVLMGKAFSGGLGVGFQAATIFASKPGYSCVGLCRAGNLAITDLTNVEPDMARSFVNVIHPAKPYRLDFAMVPAAHIEGEIANSGDVQSTNQLTLSLGGKMLPPSSSVLASTNIQTAGRFAFVDVPVGSNWWFEASWRESGEWKSAKTRSFSCTAPRSYRATLTLDHKGNLNLEKMEPAG